MKTNPVSRPLLVFVGVLGLLSASCAKLDRSAAAWQPPRPVRIEGEGAQGSLFGSFPSWVLSKEGTGVAGLLLRDGDWICAEKVYVVYRSSDGSGLKISREKWGARLNGEVVAVLLDKDGGGRAWLEKATAAELAAVRQISLMSDLDEKCLPALQRLAAVNPHLVVGAESAETLRWGLQYFKPHALILAKTDLAASQMRELLAKQTQLETLFISADTAGAFAALPDLPKLRRLFVTEWDVAKAGPLPAGLNNLKGLYVFGCENKGAPALGQLPAGLEELSITFSKKVSDLSALARLSGLKAVILNLDEEISDLSALNGLSELQWVGLPPDLSQEQFAAFVAQHRRLKILELVGCGKIKDLSPLRELRELEALIITGEKKGESAPANSARNFAVLRELKSLRYLGVAPDNFKDAPGEIAALRQALPDAMVVGAAPFCLGSGWILLLVPVVAAGVFFGSRRRRAATAGPEDFHPVLPRATRCDFEQCG